MPAVPKDAMQAAEFAETFTGVQSCCAPSKNVTVPVGFAVPAGADIVAVKVTALLTVVEVVGDSTVLVAAGLTVKGTGAEEDPAKFLSPL